MRLKKSISKSNHITYSIIRDYTTLNGKRTTCIHELLGDDENLKKTFGTDDTMGKVKEYIDSLNKQLVENKEPNINISLNPNKKIEKDINRSFFSGHLFLRKIYYDLGMDKICKNIKDKYNFTFDINSVVECLVFFRIIWPASKLSTFEQSKKFIGNYNFDIQHVYRTLSYLAKEMNNIQKDLFNYSKKSVDRNFKVIYYDCTNFFFYTEENDFQKYGIGKQHQPLPLVQMGLFMDADGYPFAMNISPGNKAESTTMIPSEETFLKDYNMEGKNIVVCTDAAMCSDEIKKFNIKDGRGFIITQSIKKLNKNLQEFALDKTGWRILGDITKVYDLSEVNEDFKKQHFNTIFYKETECETKSVVQTLIITFSYKYQEYQHKLKLHQLERAQKLVEITNKNNKTNKTKKDIETIKITKNQNDPKRFIKETRTTEDGEVACNISYCIDEEIFNNEEKYNGIYGITTNLIDDTATIIKVMKGRWEIEESFKIMKDEFDTGTVYLSREDRIKGHFITCFMSLFIYRYLEHQLNDEYTVHTIVSKLQEMKLLEHKGKGFEPTYTRDSLTDKLHELIGIETDTEIVTYKKIKNIFK